MIRVVICSGLVVSPWTIVEVKPPPSRSACSLHPSGASPQQSCKRTVGFGNNVSFERNDPSHAICRSQGPFKNQAVNSWLFSAVDTADVTATIRLQSRTDFGMTGAGQNFCSFELQATSHDAKLA